MYPSSKTIGCQWNSLTFCSFVIFSLCKVEIKNIDARNIFYVEVNPFRGLGGSRHDKKVFL